MGRYSYAMYVLHIAIKNYFKAFVFGYLANKISFVAQLPVYWVPIVFLPGCLAGSYLAGFASWNILEKHFIRLKDRFAYESGADQIPQVAVAQTAEAD
jgi:peptidoglycan/LPS O-acetylase OafA/YrhL